MSSEDRVLVYCPVLGGQVTEVKMTSFSSARKNAPSAEIIWKFMRFNFYLFFHLSFEAANS